MERMPCAITRPHTCFVFLFPRFFHTNTHSTIKTLAMSSTNDSKPTENEQNPFADSGNNETPAASTAGAATLSAPVDEVARRPGSPQAPIENPFGDDLAVHATSPTPVAATENTTATVTQPALTTVPASAPPTHVESTLAPTTPVSEREAKLAILTEAFPTVEKEVCEFVLESHRGDVEASINALLEISDPDFQPEPQQPAPPVVAPPSSVPPTLPRRQDPDNLTQGVADMNLSSNQPRAEIDVSIQKGYTTMIILAKKNTPTPPPPPHVMTGLVEEIWAELIDSYHNLHNV